MQYTHTYESPVGPILLASDGEAVTGLWFEGQKRFAATLDPENRKRNLPLFLETDSWLDCYFSGRNPGRIPRISLNATPFQKAVCEVLTEIPYGQFMTYGEVAARIPGTCARAVGNAVARNPVSLFIPCHRILGKNGELTGYAAGTEIKEYLLRLEGIPFIPA